MNVLPARLSPRDYDPPPVQHDARAPSESQNEAGDLVTDHVTAVVAAPGGLTGTSGALHAGRTRSNRSERHLAEKWASLWPRPPHFYTSAVEGEERPVDCPGTQSDTGHSGELADRNIPTNTSLPLLPPPPPPLPPPLPPPRPHILESAWSSPPSPLSSGGTPRSQTPPPPRFPPVPAGCAQTS